MTTGDIMSGRKNVSSAKPAVISNSLSFTRSL
jgi:hypothetical protein